MNWLPPLIKVKRILAKKYPGYDYAVRLIDEAGLPKELITNSSKPLDLWHSILSVAFDHDKLGELVRLCVKEEPGDTTIEEAYFAYLDFTFQMKTGAQMVAANKSTPPVVPTPATIDELNCTIELLDTKSARHTYSYQLSNFGGDRDENTFYFFAKDTDLEGMELHWYRDNGDHVPTVKKKSEENGVRLTFKNFSTESSELKRLEFCYTAPSFAFLHKETGVFSYRAQLYHQIYTEIARLTIKLPKGSTDVKYEGRARLNTEEDQVVFTETKINAWYPVGFPVFFCNTNFIER